MIASATDVFLDDNAARAMRNRRAGEDAESGTLRQLRTRLIPCRSLPGDRQHSGLRGKVLISHGVAVHGGYIPWRHGRARPERRGQHPPFSLREGHNLNTKRPRERDHAAKGLVERRQDLTSNLVGS